MNNSFAALLYRMRYIKRWVLMNNNNPENLSEHSLDCAIIAHLLANIGNVYFGKKYNPEKIATSAIYHDSSEILTGDLPTPIKYFSKEIESSYKNIENIAAEKLLSHLPNELKDIYSIYLKDDHLSADEKLIVKTADKLCALIKCLNETNSGNKEFITALKKIQNDLKNDYDSKELRYFMDNCIESFTLSLDELNAGL